MIELRGRSVTVDGRSVMLGPERPHLVHYARSVFIGGVSRQELSNVLPDNLDDHALEVAVSLRRALDVPGLITTVIKRGYRLNAVRVGG